MALAEGCFFALRYQIYELCGKGQNRRKPQQCGKKRYPYHGNEQSLFRLWFHDKILSRKYVTAGCKETACGLFLYCNQKKQACQDDAKWLRL